MAEAGVAGKVDHPGQQQVVELGIDPGEHGAAEIGAEQGEVDVGGGAVPAEGAGAVEDRPLHGGMGGEHLLNGGEGRFRQAGGGEGGGARTAGEGRRLMASRR